MGTETERNGKTERKRLTPVTALVSLLLFLQLVVFLVFRGKSYFQFHDNLDLFMAHYEMMNRADAWFAHGVELPVLHGMNRDLFGSEFLLYNLLYILFPTVAAYLIGYFLKIAIGIASFLLLARDFAGSRERFRECFPILFPVAAAFGMIPVFPTYGIAFTSVPLVIWLLRRIYYRQGVLVWYILLFLYPCLSYFSYHGFFILCYMCAAFLIMWIRDRKLPLRMFAAIATLSLGYVAFEYRLFGAMLLDHTVTIRTTMEHGELTLLQALAAGFSEFLNASFHSEDSHTYLVLPVVLVGILWINAGIIFSKRRVRTVTGDLSKNGQNNLGESAESEKVDLKDAERKLHTEPANLLLLWILLNCLNFGLYQYAPYRHLLEALVPPLTGFEFARTAYFNTFLWYALFAVILVRFNDRIRAKGNGSFLKDGSEGDPVKGIRRWTMDHPAGIPSVLSCAAAVIVMFMPQVYNDFYYTVYNHAYILVKHKETSRVNVTEYYSTPLFDRILQDLGYQGEWSAAYGMHPAILNYNGIASLDGYLGFYPQTYKEQWERVEAPAFAGSPWIKSYFEGWGARVCLYSGSDENTYEAMRYPEIADRRLMVDLEELRKLDCRYIFSRIELDNAEELGLK
nr:DUF6044 family protein [Lachnospiraceae bacterium]